MTTKHSINSVLAVVLFSALRGVQKALVEGRRTIDRLLGMSEGLGHFLANRLLVK